MSKTSTFQLPLGFLDSTFGLPKIYQNDSQQTPFNNFSASFMNRDRGRLSQNMLNNSEKGSIAGKRKTTKKSDLKKIVIHSKPIYFYPDPKHAVEFPQKITKQLLSKLDLTSPNIYLLLDCAFYNLYLAQRLSYSSPHFKNSNVRHSLRRHTSSSALQRGINFIANPVLNIDDFDFRPFKIQFGNQWRQMPFIADQMISFNQKQLQKQLFLEFDNRSEENQILIGKILNYIWYARSYPKKRISVLLTFSDGAIPTKNFTHYHSASLKMANLATRFLETVVNDQEDKKIRLSTLYEQTANLNIFFDELSSAYLDVADFLLDSNYYPDYLTSIQSIIQKVNNDTTYQVSFKPSKQIIYCRIYNSNATKLVKEKDHEDLK